MTEKESKINNLVTAIVGKVASLISTHNSDTNSHSDIRNAINNLSTSGPVTVEKQNEAETGYVATYVIKQNGNQVGSKINIPKDFLVKSGTVETCVFLNQPVGCNVGDKYIDLVINTKANPETDEHICIKVTDLIEGKVDIAQGSTNANKNVVTDPSGNITTEAKPTIPTKTSDLTNDSNYTTATGHNHDGAYIKTGTGTVTSTNIADKTIVAGDIADTTITGGKLVDGTITNAKIGDSQVNNAKLSNNAVTTAKIADSAVTSTKIADKTIVNGDIADNAAIAYSKLSGVASSTHNHDSNYVKLSGGQTMTGNILIPSASDSSNNDATGNIPYAGMITGVSSVQNFCKTHKSFIGTINDGTWKHLISSRHRNGAGDGNNYGFYISSDNGVNGHLKFNKEWSNVWGTERTLIDNENMVKHEVVNNVLSHATNNQSTAGYFKILTIAISGNYIDSPIQFTINRRLIPTTNVQFYVQYYQKDTSSSSNPRYYKLNKCYYDGQALGIYVKQTVDNAGAGTFDIYTDAEAWSDLSVTPIITNNLRNTPNYVTITPKNDFVTSLPSGYIQATRNPNYVDGSDSRLTNARTPTSHTDSNGAYGKATTSVWGHTKLNSATNSTDETTAATPKAVKAAYDLANGKAPSSHTHTKSQITDFPTSMIPTFTQIPASSSNRVDLNTYKTGGFYYINHDSNMAPYVTNCPLSGTNNRSFFLLVETWGANSTYVKQTLTYYNTNATYTRTCSSNTWGSWSKLSQDGHTHNYAASSHTHTKSQITDFPTSMTPTSHTHGYLTNDGKLGSEAGKPVMTCTDGKICAGSFGTTAGTVCQGNDSRLSNARTPTSHSHGSIANGGTLNSDITSVNKVVVTDSSNNIKTISKLPASAVTHQSITGKADKSSIPNLAFHTGSTLGIGIVTSPHAMTHSKNGHIYMSCTDQNGNAMTGKLVIDWNNGAALYERTLSNGMASLQVTATGTYNIKVGYHVNGIFKAYMMGRTTVS